MVLYFEKFKVICSEKDGTTETKNRLLIQEYIYLLSVHFVERLL